MKHYTATVTTKSIVVMRKQILPKLGINVSRFGSSSNPNSGSIIQPYVHRVVLMAITSIGNLLQGRFCSDP